MNIGLREMALKGIIIKKVSIVKKMYFYYLLLLPVIAYFILFHYIPMYGVQLAFKDYRILDGIAGSPWVGLKHFIRLFTGPFFGQILSNTLIISFYRIVFGFFAPIVFALLLNEITNIWLKRITQTISYLPYFISWVILGGIMIEMLSPSRGVVNYVITLFGGEPIYFLTEPKYFVSILIISGIWQSVGWSSIIYLAAISSIDAEQYDSAYIDGANRFHMMLYITLPSIKSIIIILFILGFGGVLSSGFDQIFNLYNAAVLSVADVIDTYVYRVGLNDMQYSYSTAVGLFKNVVGFILVILCNFIVKKISEDENGIW